MSNYRPLSRRGQKEPRLDALHEGVPAHLLEPLRDWVNAFALQDSPIRFAERAQLKMRLEQPFDLSRERYARESVLGRMNESEEFALDIVDFVLQHPEYITSGQSRFRTPEERRRRTAVAAAMLERKLEEGGSAWEVTTLDNEHWQLTNRTAGPVKETIIDLPANRAREHLVIAWNKLSGRDADSSTAYREAVRAVEAAAKPIVTPKDPRATLGKVISVLKDKPQNWQFVLGDTQKVISMAELLWTSQLDRHGTNDESVPLKVTKEQADAAVHLAITLTRYFVGGGIRPNKA